MTRFRRMACAAMAAAALLTGGTLGLGAIPNRLHVIDASQLRADELVMVQSLQGVIASKAAERTPQIWISGEVDPGLLDYLRQQYGILVSFGSDPFGLLRAFATRIKGYDWCHLPLRSLNVAAPLAGIDEAVTAATPELAEILSTDLALPVIKDVRQFNETYWCGARFADLNQRLLIELALLGNGPRHLRDLSASERAFTYTDGALDGCASVRDVAMGLTEAHSYVLGFPQSGGEIAWIRAASQQQHPAVRADTCHNLSVLSGIGKGQTHNQQAVSHTGQVSTLPGAHYVCLVMDGGWDIGWTLNRFGRPNWFGHPRRGDFPMNWEISPALSDFAPPALEFFYSQASDNDFFVSSPSGYGLLYPDSYPDLQGYAEFLGPKVKQADLRVVNVMGDQPHAALSSAGPIVARAEVLAVFYKTNNARGDYYTGISPGTYDVQAGKVIWPYRYALWNNGRPENTAEGIAEAILYDPHRKPGTDPLSYSLVAVYPFAYWDGDPDGTSIMDQVARLADLLRADPAVHLVSAEELAWLLRANFGDGQAGPRFPDVPTTHWAWESVEAIAKAEISTGYADGLFHPEVSVDRGQMAAFLARAIAGGDAQVPTGPATPTFPDVPKTHYAYRYIEYCQDQNVAKGFSDGLYRPALLIDRGQMAVFIARAMVVPEGDAGVPPPPATSTFPDVTATNDWAWVYPHVEFLAKEQVVSGYPDGLYHPLYPVTRDQMAAFIGRAFKLM